MFGFLPEEILKQIFEKLNLKDLENVSEVCTQFYRIAHEEWRKKINGMAKKLFPFFQQYVSTSKAFAKLPDHLIAVGGWDNKLYIWDCEREKIVTQFTYDPDATALRRIQCLLYLGNNKLLIGFFSNKTIYIIDYNTGEIYSQIVLGDLPECAIKFTENQIYVGARSGKIYFIDPSVGSCHLVLSGHRSGILSLTKLSDTEIVSSSIEGTLCIWNLTSLKLISKLNEKSSAYNWAYQVINLGNEMIASCHDDGIRIWNYKTSNCLRYLTTEFIDKGYETNADRVKDYEAHRKCNMISKLSQNTIVSSYGNGAVRIWDVQTGACLEEINDHRRAIKITNKCF